MTSLSRNQLDQCCFFRFADSTPAAVALLQKVIAKLKPQTSTCMKSAIVALFTADAVAKLRFSGLIGLLQLDMDRHYKGKFLRIYELETLSLVFQVELYYGFQQSYRMLREGLYIFDYPRGIIGFQFRNKEDAQIMKTKIIYSCPPLNEFQEIKKRNLQLAKKKEQQGTFFGKIKNFFGDKKEEQTHQQTEIISVRKQTSIAFNLTDGTFNSENIPPEWQEVFDSLKLTKQDLKNKEVMGIIIQETVLNQAKRQAEQQSNKELQKKVHQVQQQSKKEEIQFRQEIKRNTILQMPLPPPPPIPLLAPPAVRNSIVSARGNLMEEIRSNNLKLKHVQVKTSQGKQSVNLDISDMNREERNDHIQNLRKKLQRRKQALNRREADEDDY